MAKSTSQFDETTLRRYFSRFVRSRARLKTPLRIFFDAMTASGMSAFVFGGTLRDLMLKGPSVEPRDIDIVVDCSSVDQLESLFANFIVRKTRFGGLNLNVKGWAIDVWPLSQTWAFRELHVGAGDFHALPETTFLNVEAVTAELSPRAGTRRQMYANGFFEAVTERMLDINLEENPFPELCTVRTLVTASTLQYRLSRQLAQYVLHYLQEVPQEQMVALQLSHYGSVKCDSNYLRAWRLFIKSQMRTGGVIGPPGRVPLQMPLWPRNERSRA